MTNIARLNRLRCVIGLLLVISIACFAQAQDERTRGTPGVATQRAVMNFAELAREAAPLAAASPQALPAPAAGFTPASAGAQPASPAPASSFLALLGEGELINKPDTQGAVGPDHLMVTLNTSVRVQTRDGAVISTVPQSNFWSVLGPFDTRIFEGQRWTALSDPKVIYEPYDKRWIFVTLDIGLTNQAILLGVSHGSNPTAGWNLYRIDVDPNNQRGAELPSIGFNKDWIVIHSEQYNFSPFL